MELGLGLGLELGLGLGLGLGAGSSASAHARRKPSEAQPAGSGALTIWPCSPSQPRSMPSSAKMPASKEEAYLLGLGLQ